MHSEELNALVISLILTSCSSRIRSIANWHNTNKVHACIVVSFVKMLYNDMAALETAKLRLELWQLFQSIHFGAIICL